MSEIETRSTPVTVAPEKGFTGTPAAPVPVAREKQPDLPVAREEQGADGAAQRTASRMKRPSTWAIVLGLAIVAGAGVYWWKIYRVPGLPPYIVKTNGRLEFARIDIAVKYPGRIVDQI